MSMDHACNVREAFARASPQGVIGALFCGLTDELGHRFAFDRGGTLHLLVEFGIQSQTSCSQGVQLLLLLRGQLDDVLGVAVPDGLRGMR